MIPDMISENQTAFVGGRKILDGVLLANEITCSEKSVKKELCLLQVDFAKAYDSVNWDFLGSIMEQMRFGAIWRSWIRGCLSSVKISVLVNGSPTKDFGMERGFRQGDPLSPFLFLIAAEAMSVMMQEASKKGLFKGCRIADTQVEVSHLQFADDSLFIGDWS